MAIWLLQLLTIPTLGFFGNLKAGRGASRHILSIMYMYKIFM